MMSASIARRAVPAAVAAVVGVAAVGVAAPVLASGTEENGATYTKDIAPILERSCQQCHRPESVAPMSLLTYEQARPWARAMKYRTGRVGKPDVMPPWYIEKDIGIQHYKGDISLSATEIAAIAEWADNGAPRGEPVGETVAAEVADASGWEIGEPDLVLTSPEIEVSADRSGLVGSDGRDGNRSDRGSLRVGHRDARGQHVRGPARARHHRRALRHPPPGHLAGGPRRRAGSRGGLLARARGGTQRRRLPSRLREAAEGGLEDHVPLRSPALERPPHPGRTWRSASSSIRRATSRRGRCRSSARRPSTSTSGRCRPTRSSRPSAR